MSTRHLLEWRDDRARWYCLRCKHQSSGRPALCECLRDDDVIVEEISCPVCNGCGAGEGLHDCEACRGHGTIGMLVEIDEGEECT